MSLTPPLPLMRVECIVTELVLSVSIQVGDDEDIKAAIRYPYAIHFWKDAGSLSGQEESVLLKEIEGMFAQCPASMKEFTYTGNRRGKTLCILSHDCFFFACRKPNFAVLGVSVRHQQV